MENVITSLWHGLNYVSKHISKGILYVLNYT